jgi:hypothetical protein
LKDYRSKPGVGIRADLMMSIAKWPHVQLHTGPSYTFMNKSFEYSAVYNEDEGFSESEKDFTASSHLVGWGMDLEFNRSSAHAIAYVYQSLTRKGKLNQFTGTTLVTLSILKEFRLRSTRGYTIIAGGSISAPLSGKVTEFRYYPIQLSFGAQKNICRKNESVVHNF